MPAASRLVASAAALVVVGASTLALSPSARGASTSVVISQVYGGGGNSGATYKNDFVQLFNGSSSAVALAGWKVSYFSPTSTGAPTSTTTLSGSIAAHHSFLIQMAAGAGGTTDLPVPDVVGTAAMGGTGGRVELADAATTLVDRV